MLRTRSLIVPVGTVLLVALGGVALSTWKSSRVTRDLIGASDGAHLASGHLKGALAEDE